MAIDWKARIEAAKLARDAAKEAITEDDRAEMEMRAELARIEQERKAAEQEKRELDLQRRLESVQDSMPGEKLATLLWDEHSFVLHYPGAKAQQAWQKGIRESASNKKIDVDQLHREYALSSIVDWNGERDLHGLASAKGLALLQLVEKYPGLITSIQNRVHELAAIVLEEHKS